MYKLGPFFINDHAHVGTRGHIYLSVSCSTYLDNVQHRTYFDNFQNL